jgi:hypothetical protein
VRLAEGGAGRYSAIHLAEGQGSRASGVLLDYDPFAACLILIRCSRDL